MKHDNLPSGDNFIKKRRFRKRWHRLLTVLGSIVVFCTTYALILPAITMESGCPIPEHTHTQACYTQVLSGETTQPVEEPETPESEPEKTLTEETEVAEALPEENSPETTVPPNCGFGEGDGGHIHNDGCYDENGELTCTLSESAGHQHTFLCYGTWELTCGLEEHTHSDQCTPAGLTADEQEQVEQVTEAIEKLPDSEQIDTIISQYERSGDTDGLESWYLWLTEQITQVKADYDALSEEQRLAVTNSEKLLTLSELTAPWDTSVQMISGTNVTYQVWNGSDWEEVGHSAYQTGTVNGSECAYISSTLAESFFSPYGYTATTQSDSLTYSYNDIYTIYYKDSGKAYCMDVAGATYASDTAVQLYAYNGSAAQQFRIIDYAGNSLITPLEGQGYYVNINGGNLADGSKLALYNEPDSNSQWKIMTSENGDTTIGSARDANYLIDLPSGNQVNQNQLQIWSAGSNTKWTLVQCYAQTPVTWELQADGTYRIGLTPCTDGSIVVRYMPESTASGSLEIVAGANTRDLIEVNLYDYGSNINELYNQDSKYPGFQQDNGSTNVGTALTRWASFNFGNNLTSDLDAGKSSITNNGGAINTTANGANTAISGAIYGTLLDGYPALSDGTSLRYLFTDSAYATKKNSQSVDGLFQYNPVTGAYTFNSRHNHAQFDPSTDSFILYRQIITSNFMMYPFGNFLPFNNIETQTTQASTITKQTLQAMATRAKANSASAAQTLSTQLGKFISLMDSAYPDGWAAADCVNKYFSMAGINKTFTNAGLENIYSINYDVETDFYFGMEMKMNFMQPRGGLTGNDDLQPMVFYFTGDDDVWVYIDGVLFLDLSGIHRHVGGEIDFVNGTVKYYSLDVTTGEVSSVPYKTVSFSELVDASVLNEKGTFPDYTTHSFHFYYMERGAGSGVCRMNFNFPLLRKNSISVTKELTADGETGASLLGDPDFRFQVLRQDGQTLFIPGNTEYDILDSTGNSIGTGQTDENGVFTLKAGQTAVFRELAENAGKYFVRELLDSAYFDQYGTITVNGSSTTVHHSVIVGTDTFTGVDSPVSDMADGNTTFSFCNQVALNKTGSLSIQKTLTVYPGTDPPERFSFYVTLDGQPLPVGTVYTVGSEQRTVENAGLISIGANETAYLSGILAGTAYTVEEQNADGYTVSYQVDGNARDGPVSGTVGVEQAIAVTVHNQEKGAQLQIPVTKTLYAPDGQSHTYTFRLIQLSDREGTAEAGTAQTVSVTLDGSPQTVIFSLDYPRRAMETGTWIFYYRITEERDDPEFGTVYDQSVYTVAVEVTVTAEEMSANIADIWKDGRSLGGNAAIGFANRLSSYVLPATGSMGTVPYTVAGAVLCILAVALLFYHRFARRKEDDTS